MSNEFVDIQINNKTIRLLNDTLKILAPPPILSVSEWADQFRKLSSESSPEAGQWNTDRAPYQRAIMDAVNDDKCEEVVIMSSAQIGKTELVLNIIGFYVAYDPSPMLVIQPTLTMAETFSKDRLAPMTRDTPILKSKIRDTKSRDSGNTILHKRFPGGHITMAGANSPSSLASRPIRIALMDEVDRFPASAGAEGDPITLTEVRTSNFWNRKIIKVSTPTIKGISPIEKEYLLGSQEEWNLPCPGCGKFSPLKWGRIRFSDVTMGCEYCDEYFTEMEWKAESLSGKYVAKYPERYQKRSFRLNALASPWKSWDKLIKNFKVANEDFKKTRSNEKLKAFVNTALGETWEEKGESANDESLISRREEYGADIPAGVLVLTAGVDVQDDRFEIEVTGWGRGFESWGIRYDKIVCNMEKEESWDRLEAYLSQEFFFKSGSSLLIACSCIDTGGHYTTETYKFLKRMERKNKSIFGIKGMGGAGIPLIHKLSTNNQLKVKVFILGVDSGKEILMTRLQIKETGEGYCHFPKDEGRGFDETYIKGLNSEQRVIAYKEGRPTIRWVKKSGTRNEPLDLRNYSTAAVEILKPDWDTLASKVEAGINYMIRDDSAPRKKRTGIVNRGIQV